MDKVNPNDLARLIGSLEAYAKIAKPESQWMPQTVFALLDELERAAERNVALGAELEQYRKDAERWRKCKTMPKSWWLEAMASASRPHQHGGRSMDSAIDAAMAKEGGANG